MALRSKAARALLSPVSVLLCSSVTLPAQEIDRFIWLEELESKRALEWVTARTRATQALLASHPVYDSLVTPPEMLRQLRAATPPPPYPTLRGPWADHVERGPRHLRGLWRRQSIDAYARRSTEWTPVLDIDSLARAENAPWTFRDADCLPPANTRCLVHLSRGGSAVVEVRELDTERSRFIQNGFTVPEARTLAVWRDENSLYLASAITHGAPSAAPREIRLWRRGTPLATAEVVFRADPDDLEVSVLSTGEHVVVVRHVSQYRKHFFLVRGSERIPLDVPVDVAALHIIKGQLTLHLRSAQRLGNQRYPEGAVIAIALDDFLRGRRAFVTVAAPEERAVVESVDRAGDLLLVRMLRNVRSELQEFRYADGRWQPRKVPAPEMGTIRVTSTSAGSDVYAFSYESFLEPPTLFVRFTDGAVTRIGSRPATFDATRYLVEQHEATSKDSTRVPYFVVRARQMSLDGSTPTIMRGYGGNGEAQLPSYLGPLGVLWLSRGGAYVLANIRGGGEFGPAWHAAARREKRQNAYDDFQAIAEDLIRRGITSPRRLGILGASNGGLLMGVSFTQRPDLFGAVVADHPVLDLKRCSTGMLRGESTTPTTDERGNANDPNDWAWMRKFAPYHNVSATAKYPPVLFVTNRRDDTVHPCHARKMAALMEEMGHEVLFYEGETGGHGVYDTALDRRAAGARTLTFFLSRLHPAYAKQK